METLIVIYSPWNEDFSLERFKEKTFVIYNLLGPQFCGNSSFSGKQTAIKIHVNVGLASSGFEQRGPGARFWKDPKLFGCMT